MRLQPYLIFHRITVIIELTPPDLATFLFMPLYNYNTVVYIISVSM